MDRLLWNAARRLAYLVLGALALVGGLVLRDAAFHHGATIADMSAGSAALLFGGALVAMVRAYRFFADPEASLASRGDPYREGQRTADELSLEA